METKKKEINKLNNDITKLNNDLKNKEKIKNDLQNELSGKSKQFDELIKIIGEITYENKKLKSIEETAKIMEEKNKTLEKINENLLMNSSTNEKWLKNDLNKFYDVVIEIDSINTLTKTGWKINYNENREEIYNDIIRNETLKIGVLGLNNVGKSFILGLLAALFRQDIVLKQKV